MLRQNKRQQQKKRQAKARALRERREATKQEHHKPWTVPKMKLFELPPLFKDDVPREKRLEILRGIGRASRTKFDELYPLTVKWVTEFDPVYVLSMCAVYFIASPEGIDREAVGELDFYHHYIELLQAFALCQPRNHTARPLLGEMGALKEHLQAVGQHMSMRYFDIPPHVSTEEHLSAHHLRTEMMIQTIAVRNWTYLFQLKRILADLSTRIEQRFSDVYGVHPGRFFEMLFRLATECEEKLNTHIEKVRSFGRMRNYKEVIAAYNRAFPENESIEGQNINLIWERAGKKRSNLISMLMTHSDLKLESIYSFTLDNAHNLIGAGTDRTALNALLERIAYKFGALATHNREHFVLDNPVLSRPLISLGRDRYFSAVWGALPHFAFDILEDLVWQDDDLRVMYTKAKANYVEDELERILRDGFPHGKVLRGSLWRDPTGVEFENDLTVVIDSFALVFEAKSASVSDPAKRGAPERLAYTLRELIEAPSDQALRFIEFLKTNPTTHSLGTKRGDTNVIDSHVIKHYVPIGVTLSQLGFIGSNLKNVIAAGIVSKRLEDLAPSINLTDLESIFELLPLEIEKVHYLARRREFEAHMNYEGDELDLLSFYLDNGFNIGNAEYDQKLALNIGLKSKELDPYFIGSREGKPVEKPHLRMSHWWRAILNKISETRVQGWMETGFILLNTTEQDQAQFEAAFKKLARQVRLGKTSKAHNWVVWKSGPERRLYVLIGFPYTTSDRELRNSVLAEAIDGQSMHLVRGVAAIGLNILTPHFPYDVLARRASTNLFDTLTLKRNGSDSIN